MLAEQVETPLPPVSVSGWLTRMFAEAAKVPAVDAFMRHEARMVADALETPLAPVSVRG